MNKSHRLTTALVLVLAPAVTMTACSSSGSSKSSSDSVNIALFGQFAAQGFAYPEVAVVTKAAVKVINDEGGVNGRKIKLSVCNDQGTQPGAVKCARDAIAGPGVAALSLQTRYGEAVLPLFEQAKMAMIGNVASTKADYTSPVSFPTASPQAAVGGIASQLIAKGCNVVTFIHWDTPTGALAKPLIEKVVKDAGKKFLDKNVGPTGATDYGPIAASIADAGSTCALSFLPATDAVKWISAQKQRNPNFLVSTTTAAAPAAVLTQLGKYSDGLLLASNSPDPSDVSNPAVAKFQADMKKAGVDQKSLTPMGLEAWGNLQLLVGAIKSVSGTPDRAKVTQAMNEITEPGTTLFGAYDTTHPNSQTDWSRLFGTDVYFYTTASNKLVSEGPAESQKALFN